MQCLTTVRLVWTSSKLGILLGLGGFGLASASEQCQVGLEPAYFRILRERIPLHSGSCGTAVLLFMNSKGMMKFLICC